MISVPARWTARRCASVPKLGALALSLKQYWLDSEAPVDSALKICDDAKFRYEISTLGSP